jgi:hypothetical protein
MPRVFQVTFAVVLYAAIMASVAQTVMRWAPHATVRSTEQLAAEALTILAFGVIAAVVVHRLWLRPGADRSGSRRRKSHKPFA